MKDVHLEAALQQERVDIPKIVEVDILRPLAQSIDEQLRDITKRQ